MKGGYFMAAVFCLMGTAMKSNAEFVLPALYSETKNKIEVGKGVRYFDVSPDGKFIALIREFSRTVEVVTVNGGEVRHLDVAEGANLGFNTRHPLRFNQDSSILAVCHDYAKGGAVGRVFETKGWRVKKELTEKKPALCSDTSFSADGKILYVSLTRLPKVASESIVAFQMDHADAEWRWGEIGTVPMAIDVAPDGQTVAMVVRSVSADLNVNAEVLVLDSSLKKVVGRFPLDKEIDAGSISWGKGGRKLIYVAGRRGGKGLLLKIGIDDAVVESVKEYSGASYLGGYVDAGFDDGVIAENVSGSVNVLDDLGSHKAHTLATDSHLFRVLRPGGDIYIYQGSVVRKFSKNGR